MVSANSKLALVHGLLINSINNTAIFCQLVHNTDDDSIILLLISEFSKFPVQQILLSEIENSLWNMIVSRFGSNQTLVMKVNTLFSSYEF